MRNSFADDGIGLVAARAGWFRLRVIPPRLESVRVLGAVLVAAVVTSTGCSQDRPEPSARVGGPTNVVQFSGSELKVPAGWTAEHIQGGLLVMAAEVHDGWQANLFLEERADPDSRSLSDWLEAAPGTLRQQKQGFNLLAWIAPAAAVVGGAAGIGMLLRRWRRPDAAAATGAESVSATAGATPEELARLEAALRDDR